VRIKDLNHDLKVGKNQVVKIEELLIFSDGISATDIKQGSLGDCYLLSAMSVIAHSRPELI
jgi:hypothetical protein